MSENREYCKRIVEEIEEYAAGKMVDDDGNQLSLYDYLSDVLDYEFTIDSQKRVQIR